VVSYSPVRHNRLNGVDVSMTTNGLFTGLSPEFGDGLDKSHMRARGFPRAGPCGSSSAAEQSRNLAIGEHVSGHGIHYRIAVMRSRMHLWNVQRVQTKQIAMLS